jgi:hypothetical protein
MRSTLSASHTVAGSNDDDLFDLIDLIDTEARPPKSTGSERSLSWFAFHAARADIVAAT